MSLITDLSASMKLRACIGAILLCVLSSACGSMDAVGPRGDASDEGFENFQTAVASDRNYDVYWLGPEFKASDLTFQGPSVAGFGNDVSGGGLGITYFAEVEGGTVDLQLTLYSEGAWSLEEHRRSAIQKTNLDFKEVTVAGMQTTLITHKGTSLPVNALRVEFQFGRTHVEALASAVHPLKATDPQPNPLIDEETFLSVMENLRPYPE